MSIDFVEIEWHRMNSERNRLIVWTPRDKSVFDALTELLILRRMSRDAVRECFGWSGNENPSQTMLNKSLERRYQAARKAVEVGE